MRDKFATRLDYLLRQDPRTAADIAKLAGIGPPYLSQLRKGGKTKPTLEVLSKLAEVLGVPVEALTSEQAGSNSESVNKLPDSAKDAANSAEQRVTMVEIFDLLLSKASRAAANEFVKAALDLAEQPGRIIGGEELKSIRRAANYVTPPEKSVDQNTKIR